MRALEGRAFYGKSASLSIYSRKCLCAFEGRAFYCIDKITQMSPIDGPIGLKMNINLPQTYSDNISEVQPSKANGLGGVRFLTLWILIYSIVDR